MGPHETQEQSAEAERLYADFLAQSESADSLDFNAYCEAHPEFAAELRIIEGNMNRVRGVLERAGLTQSLSARLRRSYPPGTDPEISLEPESEQEVQFSEAVLSRLAERRGAWSRYRVKGELARGGMGAILRVWDRDLRRHLAMKVTLGKVSNPDDPDDGDEGNHGSEDTGGSGGPRMASRTLSRFLEEAQITGQLDHPGIVPVHEIGIDADEHVYFTMKLVRGRSLKQILGLVHAGDQAWTQARALEVLLKACDAVAYAHSKGVIHRDLKPGNIMVGRFGEVYVMDWGLAHALSRSDLKDIRIQLDAGSTTELHVERRELFGSHLDSPLVTQDGDVIGTPAYMPPEQAMGHIGEVSPRSDVYSMGAILYHLLTGQMPYFTENTRLTAREVLDTLVSGPPAPIESLARKVPRELVEIAKRAMTRHPAGRYADTRELAEDLRVYLETRIMRLHGGGLLGSLRRLFGGR